MSTRRVLLKMMPLAALPQLAGTRSLAGPREDPEAPLDPVTDSGRVTHSAAEPGAIRRGLRGKLGEAPPSIADFETQQSAMRAAAARKSVLVAASGVYQLAGTLQLDGAGETVAGLHGAGPGRTVFQQGPSTAPGIAASGRFLSLQGFAVRATGAGSSNADAANLLLAGTFTFSSVRNLWLTGGAYGIATRGAGHEQQFNNTFDNVRVNNWERAAWSYGGGSGSLYLNHYASAIERDAVERALECSNTSGEFIRLNIERCTIRDYMAHLSQADQLTLHGVNTEQVSLIGSGRAGAPSTAFFFWSGRGTTRVSQWWMDSCHVGGYIVTELTRTGDTATAKLELLGFQQKEASGTGIRPGDSIYVDGASEAEFNGPHKVTAASGALVTFTIRPTAPARASVERGADCIVLSLGDQAIRSVPLVHLAGNAGAFVIDSLHIRDMRVIAKSAARRASMVQLARFDGAGRAYFRHLTFGGQTGSGSHWLEPATVAGYRRRSGVATVYFRRAHNLRDEAVLHFFDMEEPALNGRTSGRLRPASPFAVSFVNGGADIPLTSGTGRAIAESHVAGFVQRVADLATANTSRPHGLGPGMMFAGRFTDPSFDTLNALVLTTPTASTFTFRSRGPDRSGGTGTIMAIEGGLSWEEIEAGSSPAGLMEAGDLDHYCAIFAPGAIGAGGVVTHTVKVQRATVGRDGVHFISLGADARIVVSAEVVANREVQLRAFNPSSGALNAAAFEMRFKVVSQ